MVGSVDGRGLASARPGASARHSDGPRSGPRGQGAAGPQHRGHGSASEEEAGNAPDDRSRAIRPAALVHHAQAEARAACVSSLATGVGDWVGSGSACRTSRSGRGRLRDRSAASARRSGRGRGRRRRCELARASARRSVGRRLRRRSWRGLRRRMRRRLGVGRRRLRRRLGGRLRGGRRAALVGEQHGPHLLAARALVGADADHVPGLAQDVGAVTGRVHEHLLDRGRRDVVGVGVPADVLAGQLVAVADRVELVQDLAVARDGVAEVVAGRSCPCSASGRRRSGSSRP